MLLTLAVIAPGSFAASATPADATRTLLVLGDSLSAEYGLARGQGWVAQLEQRLAEQRLPWTIVNASISGETSAGGRSRLPDLLRRHQPSIVLIELGANDGLRGLPLQALEANLREMVRMSVQARAQPVLVGMMIPPNFGRAYADQFAAVFERVAQTEQVPWVPFLLAGVADDPALFLDDRIHPNARAQAILLDNVWPVLEPLLRSRR
ncbi:MAG TPA: arylesterase [Burkholderiaceae bacterium]|nr:arylesterase [Burkholderiaceae bacterium]